jgi:DDE superfamily endonuclease
MVLFSLYIGILVSISEPHSYSILPALSLDGIIAIEVLDCLFTAATFNKFIEGLLDQINPWP